MTRLLTILAVLWAGPALAQGLDMSKGGPIDVTARDGIELRQNEQVVIARGEARAVRGDVTVIADTLIAHYRRKVAPPGANGAPAAGVTPASASPNPAPNGCSPGASGLDTGSNEIYRLEADGHVKIFNATDIAVGDHAVYDIDQAVLLLTGKNLMLTTPQDVFTARDTMEYWSQRHMAVGRGDAAVVTSDGRRLAGDVLVGYTQPPEAPGAHAAGGAAPRPAPKPAGGGSDLASAGGKLQRVEAFGHVEVRTATETVRGERAVYVTDTGMARIAGNVHVTRGMNQMNGDEALVNMHTGISTMIHNPGGRVQGVVMPNDTTTSGARPGADRGPNGAGNRPGAAAGAAPKPP